jgi:hypothetical protein
MDVSKFLTGNFLTHLDLPLPNQPWTIGKADQQLVGSDQKICITFAEFPAKPLGCNKTNLRRIVELYGIHAEGWVGKQLQVYRSQTAYSGKLMQCVRVCGPQQLPPDGVYDAQGIPIPPASPAQAFATAPAPAQQQPVGVPQQQPVSASQAAPWEANHAATQQNSPPSE